MQNTSGIQPVEFKVLVKPDAIEEKTAGGIILPDSVKDVEKAAQVRATLVAIGGNSFLDWTDREKLVPGTKVYVAKYAGYRVEGVDGQVYQLCNDKDIAALLVA